MCSAGIASGYRLRVLSVGGEKASGHRPAVGSEKGSEERRAEERSKCGQER